MIQKGAHLLLLKIPYWIQAGVTFDYSNDVIHTIIISNNVKYKTRFKTLTPKNVEGWVEKALVNVLN